MARRSPEPDERKVEANVARKALHWLSAHAGSLAAFAPGVTPGEAQQTAIAELGLAAWLIGRSQRRGSGPARAADVLRRNVVGAYKRVELHGFAAMGPPEGFVGQLFMRLGAGAAAERIVGSDVIRRLIDERNILALERSPARTLELIFVLDALEVPHDLPSRRTLVDLGILGRPLNVEGLWPGGIYAITHVVFFATDYGVRTAELFTPEELRRLDAITMRLIDRMIGQAHWDLLAELILTRKCLGLAGPADTAAWRALAAAQCADGSFLPATTGSPGATLAVTLARYHKCLVAALAGYSRAPGEPGRVIPPLRRRAKAVRPESQGRASSWRGR